MGLYCLELSCRRKMTLPFASRNEHCGAHVAGESLFQNDPQQNLNKSESKASPRNAPYPLCRAQFDDAVKIADDMESYLEQRYREAREAEARAEALNDDEFTPMWRQVRVTVTVRGALNRRILRHAMIGVPPHTLLRPGPRSPTAATPRHVLSRPRYCPPVLRPS